MTGLTSKEEKEMITEDIGSDVIKRMENDRYAKFSGIVLEEIRPGYAKVSVNISDMHLNGVDIIQGGLLFTLADFCFAAAANSRGKTAIAVESSISFIKGVSSGKLTAETEEISYKKTLARYNVKITSEEGELIAHFRGTAFIKR